MGENSKISWTTHTFNHVIGCTKVSAGCAHCYAESLMDLRYGKVKWGPNGTRVLTSEANWKKPLKWNREAAKAGVRARVFCASLADVFEDIGSDFVFDHRGQRIFRRFPECRPSNDPVDHYRVGLPEIRADLFALIDATPNLDWLLLTKRPENIRRMWPAPNHAACDKCGRRVEFDLPAGMLGGLCVCGNRVAGGAQGPAILWRQNVWLLTSVEDQARAELRIPELLKCRGLSPVLGLSVEPLLGPVDLEVIRDPNRFPYAAWFDVLRGRMIHEDDDYQWTQENSKLDWVIVGSESGAHRRPMKQEWARSIIDQCRAANVARFMKQMEINGKVTTDIEQFPKELQIREFPNSKAIHHAI